MEMESFSFLFPLFLFLILLAHLVLRSQKKPQDQLEEIPTLPPGRTGWPLIGETLDYVSKLRNGCLENFVLDRTNKYSSKVFKTSLMGQPVAVFLGPEGNKFLFSNENKLVKLWYPPSIEKIFPKSNAHNQVRKTLPSLLKGDALRKYIGVMDTVMKHQLHTYWDHCDQVKVGIMVRRYTLTVSSRLFFSKDDPEEVEKLGKSIQDMDDGLSALPLNLPWTALNRAIKASKSLHRDIRTVLKQRRIDLSSGKMVQQDILTDMLLATDENGQHLSESEICGNIAGLQLGGYSSINGTLTCIMKYLAELPDVYTNVHREHTEITSSKEKNELLIWEDLRKMKYSWNVAQEAMRLMPPGPGGFREATTDFTYAGYTIPKGWKCHWMPSSISKSPEYFKNPDKFDPSRFEGDGPGRYTFVPFGGGVRMCPGNEYARLAILVFMHNVVTNFRWEKLMHDEKVVYGPGPKLSHGFPIRVSPHH